MAVQNREYNGIQYSNRQLYNWFAILYPDNNETHKQAIQYLDFMDECIMMLHDNSYDKEKKLDNHYHVFLHFNQGKRLYTLFNQLGLEDDSLHLFKSWDEIKRKDWKNTDDYIIYLTHLKEDDKLDKYEADKFQGGNRSYAINVINNLDLSDQDRINNCLNDIRLLHSSRHLNTMYLDEIYFYLINKGHSYIINKKWNFFKDFIKDYRSNM